MRSNNTNKLSPQEPSQRFIKSLQCSNNTNKLSPQEPYPLPIILVVCSNNTNKLSPQEPHIRLFSSSVCSNNTNKLSPQEQRTGFRQKLSVQIIQINLVLKNSFRIDFPPFSFK